MTPPDRAPEPLSAALKEAYTLLVSAEPTLIRDAMLAPNATSLHYKELLRDRVAAWLDPMRDNFDGWLATLDAARDSRPDLLARWPEADLFAALDAEGWFRGMETREATAATAKVYARLARDSRPVGEGLPDELAVGNWPGGGGRVSKYDAATWVNDVGGAWVLLYAPRQFHDGLRLATDQPASTEAGEDG